MSHVSGGSPRKIIRGNHGESVRENLHNSAQILLNGDSPLSSKSSKRTVARFDVATLVPPVCRLRSPQGATFGEIPHTR